MPTNKWTQQRLDEAAKLRKETSNLVELLKRVSISVESPSTEARSDLRTLNERLKTLQRAISLYLLTCKFEDERAHILATGSLPKVQGPDYDESAARQPYQVLSPRIGFSMLMEDTQVKCLTYLINHIRDIIELPPAVALRVIPISMHGGTHYPAVGLYSEASDQHTAELIDVVDAYDGALERYIHEITLEQLIDLSGSETTTWSSVLAEFGIPPPS